MATPSMFSYHMLKATYFISLLEGGKKLAGFKPYWALWDQFIKLNLFHFIYESLLIQHPEVTYRKTSLTHQ